MTKIILGIIGIASFIFFLTITFQNIANISMFFFLTNVSTQGVALIQPMMFGFITGLISGGCTIAMLMYKDKSKEDQSSYGADGWN